MSNKPYVGTPGIRTQGATSPRNLVLSDPIEFMGARVIDGALSRDPGNTGDVNFLRAGTPLGIITSGGKLAPSILGLQPALHDTTVDDTTMTLGAATVTEIARRVGASGTFKITGPPTAAGTNATETVAFSAIASATTITITATTADFAAGSIITPTDGSETAVMLVASPTGIQVADDDGTNHDVSAHECVIGGYVDASQIVDYSSMDASVQAALKAQLNSAGQFIFDDNV